MSYDAGGKSRIGLYTCSINNCRAVGQADASPLIVVILTLLILFTIKTVILFFFSIYLFPLLRLEFIELICT